VGFKLYHNKTLWAVTYPGSPTLPTLIRVAESTDNSFLCLIGGLASFYELVNSSCSHGPARKKQTLISKASPCDHPVSEVCNRKTTMQAPFYLPVSLRSLRKHQQRTCLAITCLIKCADYQWPTEDCFLIDSRYQGRSLINIHNIISKLSGSTPEWSHIHEVSFLITGLFTIRDLSTFFCQNRPGFSALLISWPTRDVFSLRTISQPY